jgi:hypothetical protein
MRECVNELNSFLAYTFLYEYNKTYVLSIEHNQYHNHYISALLGHSSMVVLPIQKVDFLS